MRTKKQPLKQELGNGKYQPKSGVFWGILFAVLNDGLMRLVLRSIRI